MKSKLNCGNFHLAVNLKPTLASLEAPVAMVTEAVPISRVVFVVRVPVLDKESEANPAARVLAPFQGLDAVKSRSQEEW